MQIGGLQKFSLIDYPGKVAIVIFTQGCNLRCGYCHNEELVVPEKFCATIDEDEVFDFLKKRQGQIEAVVVTGGEPTIHKDLSEFLKKIKSLNYFVKLDTNGGNPFALQKIIDEKLVDYIAMDIKAGIKKYSQVVGCPINIKHIQKSIKLILESGLPHLFRTTVHKKVHDLEELREIHQLIQGSNCFIVQKFIPGSKLVNKELFEVEDYSKEEFDELVQDFNMQVVGSYELKE